METEQTLENNQRRKKNPQWGGGGIWYFVWGWGDLWLLATHLNGQDSGRFFAV